MKKRLTISDETATILGLVLNKAKRYRLNEKLFNKYIEIKGEKSETTTPLYESKRVGFTAISPNGGIMDIETYCKYWKLDFDKVKSFKLVSHTGVPYYNIVFYESGEEKAENEIDFLKIFKDKIQPILVPKIDKIRDKSLFDRLVITDVHVGMNVNPDGYSLYGGNWDETELNKRLKDVVNYVVANAKSSKLIIHELGDFMDGWDGFTTRGGHALPQNMDNQKAFDIGLLFKIKLIDSLMPFYNEIQCVNICNDNHAGSFGYIVNSAFKSYVELKYPDSVTVINQRKFIDHYIIDKRCFILTHGKDDKSLKFGFKPVLDSNQIEKIKNYIDENKLHGFKIEFSKGDSHQLMFDSSTSKHFEYQNFGAFSPPSNWVQTNFQNSISSFSFFNYFENQKSQYNFIF
jgi:hypothetical protein